MNSEHPFLLIPLSIAGYVLGGALILGHLVALLKPEEIKSFLKKAPRNETLGQIVLAIALFWFFLLIAPEGKGWLSALRVDLGGFQMMVNILQILTPVFFFLMIFKVKEFLFVRAMGVLGLLVVSPFLTAAFLKEPATRLLIPVWCYAVIILSLFWVGMPYTMRDQINWVTAKASRWNFFALAGIAYGALILLCSILFWQGY